MSNQRDLEVVTNAAIEAARATLSRTPGIVAGAIEEASGKIDSAVFRLSLNAIVGIEGGNFSGGHTQTARQIADVMAVVRLEQEQVNIGPDDETFCADRLTAEEYEAQAMQWTADLETTYRCLRRMSAYYHALGFNLDRSHRRLKRVTSDDPWRKVFIRELFEIFCGAVGKMPEEVPLSPTAGPRTFAMNFMAAVAAAVFGDDAYEDLPRAIYRALRPSRKVMPASQ